MKHYLFCLVDTDEAAQKVTEKITNLGFAKEEVFVFSSAGENTDAPGDQAEAEDRERRSLGGGSELLTGVVPPVVGGVGPFVGTAPRLTPSEVGKASQRESAAFLRRFDLPVDVAQLYQNRLAEGGTLIAVQVDQQRPAKVARRIFEEMHAQEISEV